MGARICGREDGCWHVHGMERDGDEDVHWDLAAALVEMAIL
jgi:hypothetical protein